ncbi:hypothetical protein [Pseudomonas sp. S150]|uniref:hypothetical protein n=1 Tax=Pseudomonas sp. S150 TaxID=2559074 RepID=UPI0021149C08|nr:hypothetical protein [Pseudomonas sp. S150]
MDTTNLQLTDYLQALQVTLKSHHEGCRIVMLEAGADTQEFDRFIDRQFRLRLQHYMLTSRARMLETRLAIKSRSTHFLLYRHDQLLAVLRATPAPFEWVSLAATRFSHGGAVAPCRIQSIDVVHAQSVAHRGQRSAGGRYRVGH